MPVPLLKRRRLSNNAIHLVRLHMTLYRRPRSLRPGDGERLRNGGDAAAAKSEYTQCIAVWSACRRVFKSGETALV